MCKALKLAGFEPVTFDCLLRGHRESVKFGPFVHGHVGSIEEVLRAFDKYKPVCVIHLAGLAYVAESNDYPMRYYDTNVGGTISLLEAMFVAGVDKLVYSSSCAVYGYQEGMISENLHLNPISPYGRSKAMAEVVISDWERAHGGKAVRLRYFNAAGADPDGEIGENHEPETHLIPLAIEAALRGQQNTPERLDTNDKSAFKINGITHPTPDGTCVRDFVHVSDLADAHVLAVQRLLGGQEGDVYNLGSGVGYSVGQVLGEVERVTGWPIRREVGPEREGDAPYLVASNEEAQAVLGWTPKFGLEDMIRHALAWKWKNMEWERVG